MHLFTYYHAGDSSMPEYCNVTPESGSIDSEQGVYSLPFFADSVSAADLSSFCEIYDVKNKTAIHQAIYTAFKA